MRLPALILLLLVSACAPPKPPAVVTIIATDFAFGAPDTIVAGLTTFRMVNHGREPHQAVIFGAPGKTFEELEAAAQANALHRVMVCPRRQTCPDPIVGSTRTGQNARQREAG